LKRKSSLQEPKPEGAIRVLDLDSFSNNTDQRTTMPQAKSLVPPGERQLMPSRSQVMVGNKVESIVADIEAARQKENRSQEREGRSEVMAHERYLYRPLLEHDNRKHNDLMLIEGGRSSIGRNGPNTAHGTSGQRQNYRLMHFQPQVNEHHFKQHESAQCQSELVHRAENSAVIRQTRERLPMPYSNEHKLISEFNNSFEIGLDGICDYFDFDAPLNPP
jgi:hypothetical protein